MFGSPEYSGLEMKISEWKYNFRDSGMSEHRNVRILIVEIPENFKIGKKTNFGIDFGLTNTLRLQPEPGGGQIHLSHRPNRT